MFICAVMTMWIECGTACGIKRTIIGRLWRRHAVV
jgi:hypothetical protein